MVSKAAIAILLIVVLIMAGIAALIGLVLGPQLAGGETTPTATDGGGGGGGGGSVDTATATTVTGTTTTTVPTGTTTTTTEPPTGTDDGEATTTSGPATTTPTTTSQSTTTTTTTSQSTTTTTTTDTGPTPIQARFFNESEIERLVVKEVNDRKNRNYDGNDTVADRLSRMARNHSRNMSQEEELVHEINGTDSEDRYRNNGLYGVCQWDAADGDYIRRVEGNNFEVLAQVYAGREYTQDGETRFNANESAVADAIVDFWLSRKTYNQRLSYGNARRLGVGVYIEDSGQVYATGNVC